MASVPVVFLLFIFLLSVHARAQQNQSNLVRLGSSLSPNTYPTSWLSPSGLFAFGFYPKGSGFAVGIWLVGQPENTIVWTANRDDPPVSSNATLHFTKNGKLILRDEQGEEKPIADVVEPAASASMLDSGNFVLYKNKSYVIWESFNFPTDTILGGQILSTGNEMISSKSRSDHSSGRFFLDMQADGNFVAYPVNSSAEPDDSYWSSGTPNVGSNLQLNLDHRGLLFLSNGTSIMHILANSSYPAKNKTFIYRATLDADGIFRLYSHRFESNINSIVSIEWSAMHDQCNVKGFCGFNSYCSSMDGQGDCHCYPGFVFVNQNQKFLGCSENFTGDVCRRKDLVIHYNVSALLNVWWSDYPYYVVQMKKEECSKSCQEDCNCGAALYTSDSCNKYKLPLRYGKRNENMSATAIFNVILGTAAKHSPPAQVSPTIITDGKKSLILILAISLGSIACLCFVLAISSCFLYSRRVHCYRKVSENANLASSEEFTLRSFSYDELEKATDDFREELGKGSFGVVYKGTLSGGSKTVAVKRLQEVVEEGEREFRAEMTAIGRTHHRNLVRLLGFCVEGSRKLLVYEYMKNGSLADFLFKAEIRPIWKERVRIALDVARGILYLHEECEVHIIHCNIKPKNILMDDSWTAKISDFGLAKLLMPDQSKASMGVRGTRGFLAPEWQRNALITVKADVFSFGVVLLEIVCCRSSVEVNVSTADEIILSNWVYNCFVARELDKLVEDEDVDLKTLERMVKVGLWCVQDDPDLRPSMKNVILMLEGTMNVPVPPSPALSLVI